MARPNPFTATEVCPTWSRFDLVRFHAFNDNGLAKELEAMTDILWEHVRAGNAKAGAILAYGRWDCYYANELSNLALKRQFTVTDATVLIKLLKEHNDKMELFINSL